MNHDALKISFSLSVILIGSALLGLTITDLHNKFRGNVLFSLALLAQFCDNTNKCVET
jgi:hypothetical protein